MFSKPSVLITGTSTGIGEACTKLLAANGWRVFAGVRKAADAKRLASEAVNPVTLDVTKAGQIKAAVAYVQKAVGEDGLQGLVNNAGIAIAGPYEFLDLDELRRQLEVNFIGQVAVTQACLPLLRLGRGRIVNMSSGAGKVAAPFMGPYAASKFALEAFSDSLRRELWPWKLHVAVIEPGAIQAAIWDKSLKLADEVLAKLPAKAVALYGPAMKYVYERARSSGERGIPPETVARAVRHALDARRPHTRYVVSGSTRLRTWLARHVPDELVDWVIGRAIYR